MNFSIIFFGISIYRLYYRSKKLSVLYQDMLYLISFSLTSTSVFINWYSNKLDEDLIYQNIKINTLSEYLCGIFTNGGNLLLLIWYGINLSSFSPVNFKIFVIFELVFIFWYTGIVFGTKIATGMYPYYFLGKMSYEELLSMLIGTLITSNVSVIVFSQIIHSLIKIKKD